MNDINELLRRLPAVEIIANHPALQVASAAYSRPVVTQAIRNSASAATTTFSKL